MRQVARSVIALAIAVLWMVPIAYAGLLLTSGPDRDGAGGLDWLTIALPLAAFGLLLLALAWLVARDRPPGRPPDAAERRVLALALAAVGVAISVASALIWAGHGREGLVAGLPVLLLGLGLCRTAWRQRRAPRA